MSLSKRHAMDIYKVLNVRASKGDYKNRQRMAGLASEIAAHINDLNDAEDEAAASNALKPEFRLNDTQSTNDIQAARDSSLPTAREIVSLLNRRAEFNIGSVAAAYNVETRGRAEERRVEDKYLLGCITAHVTGIRNINKS